MAQDPHFSPYVGRFLRAPFVRTSDRGDCLAAQKSLLARSRGFTLTEVLVAMTLLSIAVIAVVTMFTVSMSANQKAARYSVATNLAQEALEEMMAKRIDDPVFATETADSKTASAPAFLFYTGSNSYASSLTVTGAGTFTARYSVTLGTSANGICVGNVKVAITVSGSSITPVTFTGIKRVV